MHRWAIVIGVAASAVLAGGSATAAAEQVVVRSTPVYTVHGFEVLRPRQVVPSPGVDGSITRMSAQLVDAGGRPLSIRRVMLHHVIFMNADRRDHLQDSCTSKSAYQSIYGTGEERQRLVLPPGYGYRVHGGDHWWMAAMLMGHSQRTVRVRVRYRMVISSRPLTPVVPFWLRANGCSKGPSYDVPGTRRAGSVSRRAWRWRVPFDGRIVAAGSHLHAGGVSVALMRHGCSQPLLLSRARFGPPGDLVYRLFPLLHEPGPVTTTWMRTGTGLPVRRGELLRVVGSYDGAHPRAQVMAILHVYIARTRARDPRHHCPRPPADLRESFRRSDGRPTAPHTPIPFTSVDARGRLTTILRPPGPLFSGGAHTLVRVRYGAYSHQRLTIPVGATVTWRFEDPVPHNVMFAEGPRPVDSPTRRHGTWSKRFTVAGQYRLFCIYHPITMHQTVSVRRQARG